MSRQLQIETPPGNTDRVDKLLSALLPEVTRSAVQKLIEAGKVTVGGKAVAKSFVPEAGVPIVVWLAEPAPIALQPEEIPLTVLYEDRDLLVVNKPKGMVVHPAAGHSTGTLVNALLHYCGSSLSGINGMIRPGIVHRIDKDTSGLLMVAKNDFAHQALSQQIKDHSFTRVYEAVVHGAFRVEKGTVDAPIGRHPVQRKKMAVVQKGGRNAISHYEVIAQYRGFTHLRVRLETGRTHQIRVHMAFIGHPVAGDTVYGPKKAVAALEGQCLHARILGFVHPRSGEYMEFNSELPAYFTNFLRTLTLP